MYQLLGICLALAALLVFNTLASALSTLLWRALRGTARRWAAHTRAQTLFALRVSPPAVALVSIAALLLPAYVAFEPRHSNERVGVTLAALTLVSIFGVARAVRRAVASWLATRRLVAEWLHCAEVVHLAGISIPAFRIRHPFPVVAVVGALRPRLFIAAQLFDSLDREEMLAAVAHECAHLAARDNVKRAMLRSCHDALSIVPCGRSLDRAWCEESERAADERAARAGAHTALSLAGALIKIARLAPVGLKPTALPAGSYMVAEDAGGVAGRVRRLIELSSVGGGDKGRTTRLLHPFVWVVCLCASLTVVALAVDRHVLATIHEAIERIVFALN